MRHPDDVEKFHLLHDVLMWLHPMGGRTLYDEEGRPAVSVCGEHNVPPYVPGIRQALQEAAEAEIDPEMLYRRAVAIYEREDARRRREHPEWTWPAPPFEAVEAATWPPLEPESHRTMHLVRLLRALHARVEDSARTDRLRAVLARAKVRGLDAEALYRDAVEHCLQDTWAADDRRPPPAYEHVRPD